MLLAASRFWSTRIMIMKIMTMTIWDDVLALALPCDLHPSDRPSVRPSVRPSTHPSLRQFGRLAVSHSSKSVTHIEIIIICISRSAQRDSVASASTYTSTRRVRHLAPHPRQIEGHKKSTHIAHCQSNISGTCTEKKNWMGGLGNRKLHCEKYYV